MYSEPYRHPMIVGDQTGGTGVSPAGWLWNNIRAWFSGSNIEALNRGEPAPMGPRDMRPGGPAYKEPPRWGDFELLLTRRFDRGAQAYGYRFGAMSYDPLGPGVVPTRPLPATQPAANELPFGVGIFWQPQGINYGIVPTVSSGLLLTPQQAAALMGNEALAGMIPQAEFIAPEEDGFGG
jgi:hypothetical protein